MTSLDQITKIEIVDKGHPFYYSGVRKYHITLIYSNYVDGKLVDVKTVNDIIESHNIELAIHRVNEKYGLSLQPESFHYPVTYTSKEIAFND